MRLIPPVIPLDTPSRGEKLIFGLLAADPGLTADAGRAADLSPAAQGWTVLHSLDVAHHRRQLQGEIDFLVVAPGLGVLVLEVKGCRSLHRSGGMWYYGADAAGDPRGPFKQASEAMHSVRERLTRRRPHLRGVPFHSAVCFPLATFNDASEEWLPWQVIDKGRLEQRSIVECVTSVLEQARARVREFGARWFDPSAGEPTPEQCDEIVKVLRPDFEHYESPKARAGRIDEEIRHYTEQQFDALDHMRRMPRVIFDGPAGTGKTLLAIEAARRAHAAGRRALLLCFNRPLMVWLKDQVSDLSGPQGQPTVHATTVHHFMKGVAPSASGDMSRSDFWDKLLPEAAAEALLDRDDPYDELIVDEAQDVVRDPYLDVLDLALECGLSGGVWRFFGDFAHQRIYDDAVSLDAFCEGHGGGCAVYELTENCRNTPRVARLACAAAGIAPGYDRVLRPDDGVDPEVRVWGEQQVQADLLAQVLQELHDDGLKGPNVAVLSMRRDEICCAAQLGSPPWCDRLEPLFDPERAEPVDLRSGKTRYCSIHRFKGLEAQAVVLTDIESLSEPRDRSLLYVGATRAKQRLVVLAKKGQELSLRPAPVPSGSR